MLQRLDVLRLIDSTFADQPVVLTIGGTVREMLAVAGRKPNHFHSLDAMGQTLPFGLGLAMGLEQDARVSRLVVVEGDGSLLMGFSAMATAGALKPSKLLLIVLDNGVYLATGGQPTLARETDFAAVARGCGWREARDVESTETAIQDALAWAAVTEGPTLLRIPVTADQPKAPFFLEDPVVIGRQFQDWLTRP